MKKICFVTTVYVTFRCFLKNFSEYINQNDEYEIHLICGEEECISTDLPEFVKFHPVPMKRGISLSGIFAILKMRKIFKENNFDIIQYSTPNAAFYASLASKSVKAPVRLYCQWGIRYMGFEGLARFIFKTIEKIVCKCSTFIEVESHNIRNFSLTEGLYTEEKSAVIWNGSASGVDLKKFDINKRQEQRNIIRERYAFTDKDIVFAFAGRLTADKGVNELLSAFLQISELNPSAKLMIMGANDNINSLNPQLFERAKKSESIIFTGGVDNIENYYSAADVFVAPSYREGFGLVVVEAQAMGLTAIVSDVPGQVDAILPDITGITCEVKNSDSLKEAMLKMLDNKDLRVKMAENAVEFATENFNQSTLFEHLLSHRNELIANK